LVDIGADTADLADTDSWFWRYWY